MTNKNTLLRKQKQATTFSSVDRLVPINCQFHDKHKRVKNLKKRCKSCDCLFELSLRSPVIGCQHNGFCPLGPELATGPPPVISKFGHVSWIRVQAQWIEIGKNGTFIIWVKDHIWVSLVGILSGNMDLEDILIKKKTDFKQFTSNWVQVRLRHDSYLVLSSPLCFTFSSQHLKLRPNQFRTPQKHRNINNDKNTDLLVSFLNFLSNTWHNSHSPYLCLKSTINGSTVFIYHMYNIT